MLPPHPPPQKRRRRIIQRQLLLLLSQPHPPLLKKPELPLPQQLKRIIIQIIELQLHPPSLHPQFVAVKSLISDLLKFMFYSIYYVNGKIW